MIEQREMPMVNTGEGNGGEIRPPHPLSPEQKLPEEMVFGLISAIGNHEAKALTPIVMGNGNIFSEGDLYTTTNDHQETKIGWKIDRGAPFNYCRDSLSPIGLVTREVLDSNLNTFGYQITEYGRTTGIDFAGLLLKWSYEHHDFSLYKMFGKTGSVGPQPETGEDKNRAPKTRYKILFELITNPNEKIREADIINAIGVELSTVKLHLRSLGETGVIAYEFIKAGKPVSYFKFKENLPEKEPTPYREYSALTSRIYSLLKDNQAQSFLSTEDLLNQLLDRFPRYKELKLKTLRNNMITSICSDLEKQGYVERKKFSKTFHSEITISDEQKEAIASLIEVLDRFQAGDTEIRREGREFAQRVLANPPLFSTLMLKAREASPMANKQPREQINADILSIIANFPDGITHSDLQTEYRNRTGRHMNIGSITGYTRNLKGLLVCEKTKSGNVYKINPNQN